MGKKNSYELPKGYRFLNDVIPDLDFVCDKRKSSKAYYTYFLNRLLRMFEYKNLPDTIPHEILDKYLMINGIACITKDPDGELRVFYGNLGGVQDCYYRPTEFIVANPHFKETFSKNVVVLGDYEEHDGVLMRNDSCWFGLHALLSRYACLAAENTLTLRVADVLLRITSLLSAPTDKEMVSATAYLNSIEDGKLGVIADNPFFDGIRMQSPPSNNGSYLTQFIEYQQYIKGSFYNEVGLSANYNMKREAIGKGESTLDQDALLPLCEDMLIARREDLAQVNAMFGTEIEVDFSSSWKENMLEAKLLLLRQANEAGLQPSQLSSEPSDTTTETSPEAPNGDELGQVESDQGQDDESRNDLSIDEAFDELDEKLDEAIISIDVNMMSASQLGINGHDSNDQEGGEEDGETSDPE